MVRLNDYIRPDVKSNNNSRVFWRCFDLAMLMLAPPSQVEEALAGSSAIPASG